MAEKTRNWLITGCSTGLGRALAEALIARGEQVFATARKPEELDDLVRGHENARALRLDVTVPTDIQVAIKEVERHGGVDVLVNNAGYGYLAAVEEADEDEYRRMFEANFFGLISLTRAALPHMRERSRGHIVNVSSVGGIIGNPGSGYYAATKFAVVGISESLSKEVGALGIKVTVIEPGPFRTDWAGRSLQKAKRPIPAYQKTVHDRVRQVSEDSGTQQGDPQRAAEAIITVVDSAKPPLHLVLGAWGVKAAREHFEKLSKELETWETLSRSADFPEER